MVWNCSGSGGRGGSLYWSSVFIEAVFKSSFRFTYCQISYREGLGTSPCIMGLTTQDPYIQKEHTELYKILKFRVNCANIEQDTAIQKRKNLVTNVWIAGHLSGNPYISLQILKFLNGCILFNIGPIHTKLKDFVKFSALFLNIWVLCCWSHNTWTHTQVAIVWNLATYCLWQRRQCIM